MTNIFSEDETDEIENFREMTHAMSVNGEEIICFVILSDLVNGHVQISDLPKNTLLKTYAQLKANTEYFSRLVWFDSSGIEQIFQKTKKMFIEEVKTRIPPSTLPKLNKPI
ncbi:hypothetical protein [Acetonema longum]|uniref:Uncharacterized protein n=1 Tax=Acetonema longum DSM 6540 TaxID=1009370 RepID=F7NJG3_9FIRM|nr:hypothetical protein [Acetonema longum]EGO63793.1 hypothetical protein ALO_11094 [Acetonema longum DSM 6540]